MMNDLLLTRISIAKACNHLTNLALDLSYPSAALIDDVEKLRQSILEEMIQSGLAEQSDSDAIKRSSGNRDYDHSWFAAGGNPDGEKYKVLPGKYGLPDFCCINGRFVSEAAMKKRGFVRIEI